MNAEGKIRFSLLLSLTYRHAMWRIVGIILTASSLAGIGFACSLMASGSHEYDGAGLIAVSLPALLAGILLIVTDGY